MSDELDNGSDCSTDLEDDDDDSGSEDESDCGTQRTKRSIMSNTEWCGVEEATSSSKWNPATLNIFPPKWQIGKNPGNNPFAGNKMQLIARTQYYIGIYPDGKVRGTMDKTDLHTHIEMINAGMTSHVRIKGLLTNLYVAVNKKGRVYAEPVDRENTIFVEGVKGFYETYLSLQYAHKGWYLAINKAGKMKNGKKTALKQKAIQFTKRRKEFEEDA